MAAFLFWFAVVFIVYTYFGYPFILWLLTRRKNRPVYQDGYFPEVSLVIPAYNEAVVIGRKIENSLALKYPKDKLQILVAADGSDDDTAKIAAAYADRGIELNYLPERSGKMAAINRAVKNCRGEIIVFSDANNFYDPDALDHLISPFQDPQVGSTTGAKLIIEEGRTLSATEGLYWKYESKIKLFETILGSCITSVGEMLAIRKSLFSPPPDGIINDDRVIILDILKRGFDNIYVPEARSLEYVSPTAKDEITRRRRISAGSFQVIFDSRSMLPLGRPLEVWKIISHKYFRSFVPFAMILAFLASLWLVIFPPYGQTFPLIRMRAPYNWILFTAQILFYLIGLAGNWVRLPGIAGKLFYLPTYLINSNAALLMGFFHYLRRPDSHLWERVNRTNPEDL